MIFMLRVKFSIAIFFNILAFLNKILEFYKMSILRLILDLIQFGCEKRPRETGADEANGEEERARV